MKILKVSLKNLNSLRGEYVIDLEHGPLSQAGIFAITGPTGAGKSTILDAITLALYGRAARYGAKGPEDMMSRHTGGCRAEVEFSVRAGRFRASWHLNRAHGKVDGRIQLAQRRVFDAAGVTLAQNMTQADAEIERLTGLNYDRFLRSVLLAQGDFARFLRANADERADLLEQLTGTEIYTDLSKRAHEETTRREADLEGEERAQAAIVLLTEPERGERAQEIVRFGAELAAGTQTLDVLNARLDLGRQLRSKVDESRVILAREQAFAERRALSEADFQRLDLHRQAQPFCADLARLDAAVLQAKNERQLWESAQTSSRDARLALASGRSAARVLAEAEAASREQDLTRHRAGEEAAAAELATVRNWLERHDGEASLETALPGISAQLALLIEARRRESILRDRHALLQTRENTARAELANGQGRLEKAAADLTQRKAAKEKRAQELAVLLGGRAIGDFQDDLRRQRNQKELLTRLNVLLQKCVGTAAEENSLAEREASLSNDLLVRHEQAERSQNEVATLGKLVEALQENLSSARLIASFEEHRAQLTAGQACPLCGSEHHPFAGSSVESSAAIKAINTRLVESRKELKAAETQRREREQTLTQLTEQRRSTAERRIACRQERDLARGELDAQATLHGVTVEEPAELREDIEGIAESIARIEERITAIQILSSSFENALRVYDDSRLSAVRLEETCHASRAALAQASQEVAAHTAELAGHSGVVGKLVSDTGALLEPFAEVLPLAGKEAALRGALEKRRDEYSRQVRSAAELATTLQGLRLGISQSEGDWRRAREQVDEFPAPDPSEGHDDTRVGQFVREWKTPGMAREGVKGLVASEAGGIATENARRASYQATLGLVDSIHASLGARLAETSGPFADLESLRAARLTDETADALDKKRRALETEESMLRGQRKQLEQDIEHLRARQAPENEELPALEQEGRQRRAANEALVEQRVRVEEDLRRDEEKRAAQAELAAAIGQAQKEIRYWRWLHDLIGSHDGRKFRRFAQGLSLDLLVRHANRHLGRLSDRYRLHRVEGEELNLEIIDHYQAGSARPMASLSGGESFLTSLALALGLSDLAGRKVRIDSLFVDEGFGTLDADTLDMAVAALESLRTSNKTVGIISHVELLKERISAQIRLEKLPGGNSTITIVG